MSTTKLRSALPHRAVSALVAAVFGLTLALNPVSAPTADAAVSASVGAHALRIARAQIGVPYRWGGTSRAGFDCSGLVQYVYARVGKHLPRNTNSQWRATIHIPRRALRAGDLVFFYSGSDVYHVGIYAGSWNIVYAPHTGARVRQGRIWSSNVEFGRVR